MIGLTPSDSWLELKDKAQTHLHLMDATRSTTPEGEASGSVENRMPEIGNDDSQTTSTAPTLAESSNEPSPNPHCPDEQVRTGPVLIEYKHNTPATNELRRRNVGSVAEESTADQASRTNEEAEDNMNGGGFYECNICFDTATHPVLTLCGHLFCWSCLGQWLNQQSRNPTCPVCKAGCDREKVIPIYGRGKEEKDPRNDPSIPTRPSGQRPPPLRDPNLPSHSFFGQPLRGRTFNTGNVTIAADVGLFPFGMAFNMRFNRSNGIHGQPQNGFLSRLFLMIMSLFIVGLIFS
ncbi:hypothetical protein CLU79DRAFT_779509 [Phycomyces nitens]|nr:hypothetical protein CLU79DRAFT_779509 [Phycomyces nitens]